MAREVVWTDPAWEDLEAAAEYIARDSEAYAAAFVEGIKAVVPEIGDASIRELLVRPYRLVYQLTERQARILTIIHGARRAWRT